MTRATPPDTYLAKYCGLCRHLSLAEWQQEEIAHRTGEKPGHYCLKLRERVYHHGHHPNILRPGNCPGKQPVEAHDPRLKHNGVDPLVYYAVLSVVTNQWETSEQPGGQV